MKLINFLILIGFLAGCNLKIEKNLSETGTQHSDSSNTSTDTLAAIVNNCVAVDSFLPDGLYVLIGQKLQLTHIPYESGDFDNKFCAEYLIKRNVYGDYPNDTIRFMAYDHYGWPYFSEFENVLLFVSSEKGNLYHQKYQFFDVYKTRDGKWASIGDPYKYEPEVHRKGLKAIPMEFTADVRFERDTLSIETFNKRYPYPYFKIESDLAIPIMGTPVETLFEIKKQGVLKARGLF